MINKNRCTYQPKSFVGERKFSVMALENVKRRTKPAIGPIHPSHIVFSHIAGLVFRIITSIEYDKVMCYGRTKNSNIFFRSGKWRF